MKETSAILERDQHWMERALAMAAEAGRAGEVPVGAVAVYQDQWLASARNRSIELSDPTAHAEILLLREAGRLLGNYRLAGIEIFVTLEPCPMCAGALIWARVQRLIFAASDPKAGAVSSCAKLLDPGRFNHSVEVAEGILPEESTKLLQDFFRQRRQKTDSLGN